MSDPILVETLVTGMITLRGDMATVAMQRAVKTVAGTAIPEQRQVLAAGQSSVVWMSPDELLLVVSYDTAEDVLAQMHKLLAGRHYLAVNVSDARTLFRLKGKGVREVLAKGAPVDLAPGQFDVGSVRRTRIGLLAAAFWMPQPDAFHIVCFRSVASHMESWLKHASREGSLPGVFPT